LGLHLDTSLEVIGVPYRQRVTETTEIVRTFDDGTTTTSSQEQTTFSEDSVLSAIPRGGVSADIGVGPVSILGGLGIAGMPTIEGEGHDVDSCTVDSSLFSDECEVEEPSFDIITLRAEWNAYLGAQYRFAPPLFLTLLGYVGGPVTDDSGRPTSPGLRVETGVEL
jgi:hypothetical protein